MKIIDKINKAIHDGKPFFSFEYFPPKTDAGVENLFERIDRMAEFEPLFCDITWGAGGTTADLTLEISMTAQNLCCVQTMMHLTCTNMEVEKIEKALKATKEGGVHNILALRGDPPVGQERWTAVDGGFSYAVDLVRYIRKEYGDFFGIGVAGYPESHTECASYEEDLKHLKEKVDAGADFIITQLFYDVDVFVKYVKDCRALGITVPILPGIMPIHNYAGFKRMTGFCKTRVPQHVLDELEAIKDNDEAVKEYGVKLGIEMCRKLLDSGAPGLHFYTLNLEKSVTKILEGLGLISTTESRRQLPWRPPTNPKRNKEQVRPIFWANRPKSYLSRTSGWDDFPNGRWGDVTSPAYGDLNDYHLCNLHSGKFVDRKALWGEHLDSLQDVYSVFASFCEGKVPRLPWCEAGMAPESGLIQRQLAAINRAGFLTINSQPKVNGAPSSDSTVGWGTRGGYVFQKAYIEFFCSPELFEQLMRVMPGLPSIAYMAVDARGNLSSNAPRDSVNAVTWGVFPCKEIIQPTVVDARSFLIWKDEAFGLWKRIWGAIYPEGSSDRTLIDKIHDTFLLVNIVDNDFVRGEIFDVFRKVLGDAAIPSENSVPS
eukprot:tig00021433_g21268.t1